MSQSVRQTHLEFYRTHQISPVRYDLSDMDAHFERRYSLYSKLGLPPIIFKQANVLEVAAGTGHNSLYVAQLMPSKFVLLEPNETASEYINKTYSGFDRQHTFPEVISLTLEEYSPEDKFDILLCENWLGTSNHEISLLHKLSHMIVDNGILVITTISPIGLFPNILRRLFSTYLAPLDIEFRKRTDILTMAFYNHLDTLKDMTRNKEDWVQDNMINPAYFKLCLNIPKVLKELGNRFDVLGTFPLFSEDWRWFKSLYGSERKCNEHLLSQYWNKAHNFLDYREPTMPGKSESNIELEMIALSMMEQVALHEEAYISKNKDVYLTCLNEINKLLDNFIYHLPEHLAFSKKALQEAQRFVSSPDLITAPSIADMKDFKGLFGRETGYISLVKRV